MHNNNNKKTSFYGTAGLVVKFGRVGCALGKPSPFDIGFWLGVGRSSKLLVNFRSHYCCAAAIENLNAKNILCFEVDWIIGNCKDKRVAVWWNK